MSAGAVVCFLLWLVDCECFVALGKRRDSIIVAHPCVTFPALLHYIQSDTPYLILRN
jgi:hypothetical protein